MVEASALEQFEQAVRLDEQRKQEIALLLRELRDAHANDDKRHKEIIGKLNYIEKLLVANYNQNNAIYTLLCGDRHTDLAGADELRRELEQRALDRDVGEIKASVAIRADKVDVGRDFVGRDKIDTTEK